MIVSFIMPFLQYQEEQSDLVSFCSYDFTLLMRKWKGQGSCWDLGVCAGVKQGGYDQEEWTWRSEGERDALVCR